jgi:peroxiredoxin
MWAVSRANRVWKFCESWLVVAAFAISLALNVYLEWRLRSPPNPTPELVQVGRRITSLTVENPDGGHTAIDWASEKQPTLLYMFSPACGWCARNLPNIKSVAEALRGRYRVIGLAPSSAGLAKYIEVNGISFPVYANAREANGSLLAVDGTPATLIISPNGVIKDRWQGAYIGRIQEQIEKTLGVRLPGLIQPRR